MEWLFLWGLCIWLFYFQIKKCLLSISFKLCRLLFMKYYGGLRFWLFLVDGITFSFDKVDLNLARGHAKAKCGGIWQVQNTHLFVFLLHYAF